MVDISEGPSLSFSQAFACPECGLSFDELQPTELLVQLVPTARAPECSGIGTRFQVDADLVVPQPDLSLEEGAIAPVARPPPDDLLPASASRAVATAHDIDHGRAVVRNSPKTHRRR